MSSDQRSDDDGSAHACTFFMLDAAFVRQYPGKSLPFFQEIRDKYTTDEPLVEVSLDYADVVKGIHIETTLAVSHRWMQPDDPDPDGEQLKALKGFLNSPDGKKIERVWIDSACMPQDHPKENDAKAVDGNRWKVAARQAASAVEEHARAKEEHARAISNSVVPAMMKRAEAALTEDSLSMSDVPELVLQLSIGGDKLKERAAVALGYFAYNDVDNQVAIARAGGIAPLVALASGGTDGQKEEAAAALRCLARNADNKVAIAKAGGIVPLVALARDGTGGQKEEAAGALGNLACNADNKVAIAKAGGIAPLVALARGGTDGQKEWAVMALANLAHNADNKVAIAKAGGIVPLVALARGGTDGQKEYAAGALRNLAINADNQVAIAKAGGIAPLVALARDGTDGQKEYAAGALRNLAINADNKVAIEKAGGIAPVLLQSCSAELTGIERKPELNGCVGRIMGWDASSGRYYVSLDGFLRRGLVVSVKPDNLILPPGARATVVGLVSQPRWNGSTCLVVSFDRVRRRYTVQMKDESTHLALKLENLVQAEAEAYLSPEKAEEARQEGNVFFKRGPAEGPEMYAKAIEKYSEAMRRNPKDHVPYSNRAACYQKLMEWQLALKDADRCVEMEPTFVKGWSRKAGIHFYLKEYHKALDAYDRILKLEPANEEAKSMTEQVLQAVNAANQSGEVDQERQARAMADPEIQAILGDPQLRSILGDMQTDPKKAQAAMADPTIAAKLQKLIAAGVLQVR